MNVVCALLHDDPTKRLTATRALLQLLRDNYPDRAACDAAQSAPDAPAALVVDITAQPHTPKAKKKKPKSHTTNAPRVNPHHDTKVRRVPLQQLNASALANSSARIPA